MTAADWMVVRRAVAAARAALELVEAIDASGALSAEAAGAPGTCTHDEVINRSTFGVRKFECARCGAEVAANGD